MNNFDECKKCSLVGDLEGHECVPPVPKMNNIDEFICSKANITTDTEAVEWMSNAVQYLREQQERIARLERQLAAALEALEELAKSPTPAGKYWKDFANDALHRIREMK